MSEWWTYRPSDFLLFSSRTYWRLFELHNTQWWPLHLLATGLALAALAWWWWWRSARPLLLVVGGAWLFVAWAFHLQRYAGINWAASGFATVFAVQGLLLLALAAGPAAASDVLPRLRLGWVVLLMALVLYPFAGIALGRPLAQAEVFGIAPDPTVVATFGALLLARPAPRLLWQLAWTAPSLWCVCSCMTLWVMQGR